MSAANLQPSAQESSVPTRTCVGCRRRDAREALVRLVAAGHPPQAVPDLRRRGRGRGASVHPRRRCFEQAVRRGSLPRALRAPVRVDLETLVDMTRRQFQRRIEGLLVAARHSGKLSVGTHAVRRAIRAGEVELLVVAGDAAGRREELQSASSRLARRCVVVGTKRWLGGVLGREVVGVAAVLDRAFAEQVLVASERVEALRPGPASPEPEVWQDADAAPAEDA